MISFYECFFTLITPSMYVINSDNESDKDDVKNHHKTCSQCQQNFEPLFPTHLLCRRCHRKRQDQDKEREEKLQKALEEEKAFHQRNRHQEEDTKASHHRDYVPSARDRAELKKWTQLQRALVDLHLPSGDVKDLMQRAFERRDPNMSGSTAYYVAQMLGDVNMFYKSMTLKSVVIVPDDGLYNVHQRAHHIGIWLSIDEAVNLMESSIRRSLFAQCKIRRHRLWNLTETMCIDDSPVEFDRHEPMRIVELFVGSKNDNGSNNSESEPEIFIIIQRKDMPATHELRGFEWESP